MALAIQYEGKTDEIVCPLCKRSVKTKKCKPLYGVLVCKRDLNRFLSRRQAAYILDGLTYVLLVTIVIVACSFIAPGYFSGTRATTQAEDIFWSLCWWVVFPLVFCCKDGLSGYSPGKYLCGVRVLDQQSYQPITFLQSLKRNLCLNIPIVPFIVLIQMNKGPRMGDRWARTNVIWKKFAHALPFDKRGNRCKSCGYDLTGNISGRCSECGTPITTFAPTARPAHVMSG